MDSRIHRKSCFSALVLVMCAAATFTMASRHAVALQPPSINQLVTIATEFSDQQRQQVEDYAQYWVPELLSDNLERVRLAKRRLLEPFGVLGIRRVFRDEYARAAVPELEKVIGSANTFAAVNAVQITAEFQNDVALSALQARSGAQESRWQIRLWAARGIERIVRSAEDIPPRSIDLAVRELSRAGENESHWLVLQRQFEAIAAAKTERSQEAQVSLLERTLQRIAEDASEPSELMMPVHRSLLLLRNQLLDPTLPSSQLRSLGTETAPLLGQVLEIGILHWDAADADENVRLSYHGAMSVAKALLELVDSQVRGPQAQRPTITTAWGNGNKSTFEADVARWQSVLNAPPYAGR